MGMDGGMMGQGNFCRGDGWRGIGKIFQGAKITGGMGGGEESGNRLNQDLQDLRICRIKNLK